MTAVAPALRAVIDAQETEFADMSSYNANARRFHEALVAHCGSATMIVVLGSLEAVWSAQESSVWDEARPAGPDDPPQAPMAAQTRRAALHDHERILTAIEAGDPAGSRRTADPAPERDQPEHARVQPCTPRSRPGGRGTMSKPRRRRAARIRSGSYHQRPVTALSLLTIEV
jgi:hypothetical protein